MAEETVMTPVEGAEPPKANPLAKPAASASSSTLKLKPVARAAGAAGATQTGLKLPPKPGLSTAGLKLPPKPGLPTATGLKLPPKPGLASGLKLPPKPGLPTQTGLKLPPKPGLATAGLKLPSKPVIRKPGSTLSMARPTVPGLKVPAKPAAPAAAAPAPVAPAPVAPAPAAPATPVAPVAAAPAPVAPAPAAPEMTPVTPTEVKAPEAPLEALKSATQHLKSVTAPIPQQAILRKTGILAEDQSESQKQAAKSKTSRISLSEAMGAAPVLNENAPMKTIRIKRPIDIPGMTKTKPAEPATSSPDTQASTVVKATPSAETPAEPAVTLTQRKTLKISRPSSGTIRPSGKFGIKRPGTMMTAKTPKPADAAAPAGDAPAAADAAAPAAGDVPEIADIPSLPTAPVPAAAPGVKDLPAGVTILGIVIQAAACVAMGALAWFLYSDTQILPF